MPILFSWAWGFLSVSLSLGRKFRRKKNGAPPAHTIATPVPTPPASPRTSPHLLVNRNRKPIICLDTSPCPPIKQKKKTFRNVHRAFSFPRGYSGVRQTWNFFSFLVGFPFLLPCNGQIVGQPRKRNVDKMSEKCRKKKVRKTSKTCPEELKTQFSDFFCIFLAHLVGAFVW